MSVQQRPPRTRPLRAPGHTPRSLPSGIVAPLTDLERERLGRLAPPSPPAPTPRPRRWYRRPAVWIVGATLLGWLTIAGLGASLDSLEHYSDDLTDGSGDFPVTRDEVAETSYRADGYHVSVSSSGWLPLVLQAPTPHTVLGVEVTYAVVSAPQEAAFGPACFQDEVRGYGLLVTGAGEISLVGFDEDGSFVLATRRHRAILGTHRLTLGCDTLFGDELVGYLDGAPVIEAGSTVDLRDISWTGFLAGGENSSSGEWRVERFARLDPDDMPSV